MSPKLSLAILLGTSSLLRAESLDFYRDIYPSLKANCIACHNKTTSKGGLDMETPESMLKGGDGGPGLVSGKGEESLVVLASKHLEDLEMPPANNKSGAVNLTPEEIALFSRWIDEGAKSSTMEQKVVAWQKLSASVQPIYTVAVSPDGRYAVCGRANRIFVYDLSTQALAFELQDATLGDHAAHRAVVQSLAFSPDGQFIASGSYREAKLWKMQDDRALPLAKTEPVPEPLLQEFTKLSKLKIACSTLSHSGAYVLLGAADGNVQVWDTKTKTAKLNSRITAEQQRVQLESERKLAKLTLDLGFHQGLITKITAQDKSLEELLKKAKEAVVAMNKVLPEKEKALAPAQAAVATAQKAVDEAKAALGDTQDPAKIKALKDAEDKWITANTAAQSAQAAIEAAKSNIVDALADQEGIGKDLLANKTLIEQAKAEVAAVQKLQAETNTALATFKKQIQAVPASSLSLTEAGDILLASYPDGTVQAWSVTTGTALASAKAPTWKLAQTLGGEVTPDQFADRINAVSFSPDGKLLATGGGDLSRSGDIHLFEIPSGKLLHAWKDCHEDSIFGLAFSPDGKLLIAGSADKTAKGFEVATGKQTLLLEGHTNYVNSVAFRADGRVIATAGADGIVMTWDATSGERIRKMQGWVKEITSISFVDQSAQLLASSGENLVRVMAESGSQVRAIADLPNFMQSAVATPGGKHFIGGGEDSVLRIWEATTGKELAAFGPQTKP